MTVCVTLSSVLDMCSYSHGHGSQDLSGSPRAQERGHSLGTNQGYCNILCRYATVLSLLFLLRVLCEAAEFGDFAQRIWI